MRARKKNIGLTSTSRTIVSFCPSTSSSRVTFVFRTLPCQTINAERQSTNNHHSLDTASSFQSLVLQCVGSEQARVRNTNSSPVLVFHCSLVSPGP
ncbi:hypothetical protein CDAR_81941 [Caerostris darwini]|uniref:Uncharacterized protein n=1 Tax=Caerostris darwini TaxID=1538125 RepID=A0AAV4V6X3_9ARAC|nr:hypothetical protein CDAR_81941 [Caerostris darwini]